MQALLSQIARHLHESTAPLPGVVVGFDGFVDEMISVVAERQSLDAFLPVPDIATFGRLVTAAAGHSSLREIVVTAVHPGGCAINLGDGLAALGVPVEAFATLGEPPHRAFTPVIAQFRQCHSWGQEPGRTLAMEFRDGKLMFSAVRQLANFDPQLVAGKLADGTYAASCTGAGLIALTDWTLFPHMTAVWRLLQERVFSTLTHRPAFFVDLVDPSSRSEGDIRAMTAALAGFEAAGPLTLGLNHNEANILTRVLGLPATGEDPGAVLEQAEQLRQQLAISEVVVHCLKFAVSAQRGGGVTVKGSYCAQPKKSTGAGDRFNAGFCLGSLLGLEASGRLALGCAASSFFIRNGRSANRAELAAFLERDYLALDEGGPASSPQIMR